MLLSVILWVSNVNITVSIDLPIILVGISQVVIAAFCDYFELVIFASLVGVNLSTTVVDTRISNALLSDYAWVSNVSITILVDIDIPITMVFIA